ncbi:MAG: hypothetical protein EAZ55_04660 [Cytophagales bacterium]|nr:MAG: hypothetical protein EAZ55_04660 [Cytophagales bacterium]
MNTINDEIDQLMQKLNTSTNLQERVDMLNHLSWRARTFSMEKSENAAQEALHIAQSIFYPIGLAEAKINVAFARYYYHADYSTAFQMMEEAYEIFEAHQHERGIGQVYGFRGLMLWAIGEYEKAFNYVNQALTIFEKHQFIEWMPWANYMLGSFYLELKDYNQAKKYHEKSAKLFEQTNDILGQITSIIGLGTIYLALGDTQLALHIQEEALNISVTQRVKTSEARALAELGIVYEKLGNYEKSIDYQLKSLALRIQLNNKQGIITCHINLGQIYQQMQQPEKSIEALKQGYVIAKDIKTKPKLMKICQQLAQIYKEVEKPWEALQYFEEYMQVKTDMMGEENTLQLKNVQAVFQVEKAKQEAEIQKLKNVELRKAYEQIEAQTRNIIDSIQYAKRIQDAILPPAQDIERYADNGFIFYEPKDIVSGDFYWLSKKNNKIIIAAVDCTGHGVPGAFMVVMANSLLNQIVNENDVEDPSLILQNLDQKVRDALHQQRNLDGDYGTHDGMDLILISLDLQNGEVTFAGARNGLYLVRNGQLTEFRTSKYPIGSNQYENKTFEAQKIKLQKQDMLYLSTDGYQDQFGGQNKRKYMRKNFKQLLVNISQSPLSEQAKILKADFETWKNGHEQTDDVLVLGIRI